MEDDFDESKFFSTPASAPVNTNPLAKYFRTPGLHVKLPSNGTFMPPGSIELAATGEVPVYPMRAADELLMKNPDALMSGFAIEEMLASCVPSIKDPKQIAMPDLDVLFLAIRAASYGPKMEIETKCPKCEHENAFEADLPAMLTTMTDLPTSCPVRLSDEVVVNLRPYNLRNATTVAITAFQETRRLQFMEKASDEERNAAMNESFRKITDLNTAMTSNCILSVTVPEQIVRNPVAIKEFMANVPREWSKKIDGALKDLNSKGLDKKITATCSKCTHQWETELEFDPASFFGQGS